MIIGRRRFRCTLKSSNGAAAFQDTGDVRWLQRGAAHYGINHQNPLTATKNLVTPTMTPASSNHCAAISPTTSSTTPSRMVEIGAMIRQRRTGRNRRWRRDSGRPRGVRARSRRAGPVRRWTACWLLPGTDHSSRRGVTDHLTSFETLSCGRASSFPSVSIPMGAPAPPSCPIGGAVRCTVHLLLWPGPGESPGPLDRLDTSGEKALAVGRFGLTLA